MSRTDGSPRSRSQRADRVPRRPWSGPAGRRTAAARPVRCGADRSSGAGSSASAGLAHHLEPRSRQTGQELPRRRGDAEHAARPARRSGAAAGSPRRRSRSSAAAARTRGGAALVGREARRRRQAAADRADQVRDAETGQRAGVAHGHRHRLVGDVEPLAARERLPDPAPGPDVERDVARLQHAVEPLRPAERRRARLHSTTRTPRSCSEAGVPPALVVGQQRHLVPRRRGAAPTGTPTQASPTSSPSQVGATTSSLDHLTTVVSDAATGGCVRIPECHRRSASIVLSDAVRRVVIVTYNSARRDRGSARLDFPAALDGMHRRRRRRRQRVHRRHRRTGRRPGRLPGGALGQRRATRAGSTAGSARPRPGERDPRAQPGRPARARLGAAAAGGAAGRPAPGSWPRGCAPTEAACTRRCAGTPTLRRAMGLDRTGWPRCSESSRGPAEYRYAHGRSTGRSGPSC